MQTPSSLSGLYCHGIQGLSNDHELWNAEGVHIAHPVRQNVPQYKKRGTENPGWNETVQFYEKYIAQNKVPDIIVGHSAGARFAMELLLRGHGRAGVLITPAANKSGNTNGYDWLVDIETEYQEQIGKLIAMNTLDEKERERIVTEFRMLGKAPDPLPQLIELAGKNIPILHFQVHDDPWQIEGISRISGLTTHTLNTRTHWPHLSTVEGEMREVYGKFLKEIRLIENEILSTSASSSSATSPANSPFALV